MQYLTMTGKTFEDALAKAYKQYGKDIHIYSRRTTGRTHKETEISFYIIENKRKVDLSKVGNEENDSTTEKKQSKAIENKKNHLDNLVEYARDILTQNDFSKQYMQKAINSLKKELENRANNNEDSPISENDVELILVDYIISSLNIDMDTQVHPPRIFVLLGPTGVGKTTTIAKIAALFCYEESMKRNVGMVTLDTFRVGAYEQSQAFARALGLECKKAGNEKEFFAILDEYKDKEIILVDTLGKSPKDTSLAVRLKTLLSVPPREEMGCYLVVSASMKSSDITSSLEQFSTYNPKSLIVTKIDETETIGNILSISDAKHLSLLFITDGQLVPQDIHLVSSTFILSMLKGFSIDFSAIWQKQIN